MKPVKRAIPSLSEYQARLFLCGLELIECILPWNVAQIAESAVDTAHIG